MHRLIIGFFLILIIGACSSTNKNPLYETDIAPIIYRSCSPCHRPNQIGHFNLLTYDDVKQNAQKIVYTIKNRLMPPWPADIHYTQFAGQNTLTDDEIALIDNWVVQGCKVGDRKNIPKIPEFPERSFLGKPDLQIPVQPVRLAGNYSDRFLLIKVPFELPQDTFVQSIEFVPGNTKVVHHVNGDMVRFEFDKKKNLYDGDLVANMVHDSTIVQAYKRIGILHDDGTAPTLVKSVVNYLPGAIAQKYPAGIGGWKVNRKNAFLLADLHYGPSVEDAWDSSYINIFYAKKKPERPLSEFQLGTLGLTPIVPALVIPPNKISTYKTSVTLLEDISVITINPHMHLLGKSFLAYALSPTGDTIRLIHIPRWDFNWQNFYTYKKPVHIPAGYTIWVEGVFDNTANNPYNPNHPPKEVRDNNGSMRTTDEMFQFIVLYLPYQDGDEKMSLE